MQTKEYIEVYIRYKEGRTVCICPKRRKKCNKPCTPEVVERNRFRGWKDCFNVNKYGKTKGYN